ncbi:MAG: hypothetical protein M3203_06050 [Actinomycetota bacterium]|nr:hypothetical protein [Actinomycetota bacterium]
MERLRRLSPLVAGTAGAVAYAWVASGLRPFTRPALAAVLVAGVVVIALGSSRRRPSDEHPPGVAVWAVLVAVLGAFELVAYLQHPRADHPTLSFLADQVLDWRPARALAFVAWLAAGMELAWR